MSAKGNEIHPLGEQLNILKEERRDNVVSIMEGSPYNGYSNYSLEGVINEEIYPVVTVALFPTYEGEDKVVFAFEEEHEPASHYWTRIKELNIPERIKKLEDRYYGEIDRASMKKYKDIDLIPDCAATNMPLIVIMFSKTFRDNTESVHIFHRARISPSMALENMQEAATDRLTKSS